MASVPSSELDAPAARLADDVENLGDDAVLTVLRGDIRGVREQPSVVLRHRRSISTLTRGPAAAVLEEPAVRGPDAVAQVDSRLASRAPRTCRRRAACAACRRACCGRSTMSPSKPTMSAINSSELGDRHVLAPADVDDLRRVVALHQEAHGVGQVVDMEELAARRAGAPDGDLWRACCLRLVELAQQRRQHVRRLQVEVVAGAVQIGRHHGDRVEAVLLGVRLAHLDAGDLRDRVPLVGRLERPRQQRRLAQRLRREARDRCSSSRGSRACARRCRWAASISSSGSRGCRG